MGNIMRHLSLAAGAAAMSIFAAISAAPAQAPAPPAQKGGEAQQQGQRRPDLTRGTEQMKLKVDGKERAFWVFAPKKGPSADRPRPLLFILHGGGGQALPMRILGFDGLAGQQGFVTVYPVGLGGGWADGRDVEFLENRNEGADDIAFFKAMIDKLVADKVADPKRVYVTGPSNGGMMAFHLACMLSDRVTAIAPVIANMPRDLAPKCQPKRPVPVMLIAGTEDKLMPYSGGRIAAVDQRTNRGEVLSVADTMALWRKLNGCQGEALRGDLPDSDPGDGTRVRTQFWTTCSGQSEVALYTVEGGGHRWPGRRAPEAKPGDPNAERIKRLNDLLGRGTADIAGITEIWTFLRKHTL